MTHLLTLSQTKMNKSDTYGYLSAVLHLEPAYKYKGNNTCRFAGKCKATCIAHTGRNRFDNARAARIRRTQLYYEAPVEFYTMLCADIFSLIRKAKRESLIPTVRLNGTSDIPFENDDVGSGKNIFQIFPDLQFIDYTKWVARMFVDMPPNYHLTYSINEKTPAGTVARIYRETRYNAAQVFVNNLPKSFTVDDVTYPRYLTCLLQ